jgi:invasion protein IalB
MVRRVSISPLSRRLRNVLLLVAASLLLAGVGAVVAQQPATRTPARPPARPSQPAQPARPTVATPDAASSEPQQTSATYEDWVVNCQMRPGPPAQRVCEMQQVTQAQVQGASRPFSRVVIPRPDKGQPVKLVVQVPVNVAFRTEVRIVTGDADPGLSAPFAQCVPSGCFAEFELKDETIKRLGAIAAPGKLTFADAGGREVSVPISFKGFTQAYDALVKD